MENLFKDEASYYIFALCYADAQTRSRMLHIDEGLYSDKNKAKEWFKTIYSKIVMYPDFKLSFSACKNLEYLYLRMIGEL